MGGLALGLEANKGDPTLSMLISLPSEGGRAARGRTPAAHGGRGSPTLSVKGTMRSGNQDVPPTSTHGWKLEGRGSLKLGSLLTTISGGRRDGAGAG